MSRVSKGQSGCKVFKSGSTYLWQQPLVSNIQTQSRSSKSKTWTRPVSTQSPASDAQTTPSLSTSLLPALVELRTGTQRSQQPQPLKRTTSHAVGSSNPGVVDLNPETRRLIHKGRYKLVQVKQQQTSNQQQRLYPSLQHRKRALSSDSSTISQIAKRRNIWVRSTTGSSSAQAPSAVVASSKVCTPNFVRSSHTRKLQLIRKLSSTPATSLARRWSRTSALARRQPPGRPTSNIRRPILGVRTPGIVKPGKLQRIGGVLYKVGGSYVNRSLQRQTTPQILRKQPASQAAYVKQGNHLVLRSLLTSPSKLVRKARPVVAKGAVALKPAAIQNPAFSNRSALKLVRRRIARKPNKLHRGNVPAQAHCLVYCRTGHCKEQQAGKCSLVHDPAAVAVCPAWLQGTCSNAACKLQHCKCPDVMPVCIFYLQGLCTTEDCPYAHVKVDPSAPVCQDFVKGYCPRGMTCTKKHLAPRMIRQLRQSKALQADTHASVPKEQNNAAISAVDVDLRPSFLRT